MRTFDSSYYDAGYYDDEPDVGMGGGIAWDYGTGQRQARPSSADKALSQKKRRRAASKSELWKRILG